ncbi:MAG: ABC transporter ATP-binding protein/permease [Alphaproteobacteria bacterium]|nr:ABC transporter ATP-binding protein/permease [Alphaproteobacteria bacterium]
MTAFKPFLRDLWALSRPYWFSEERWPARGLLAVIVGMNLGLVYLSVLLNQWNNAFYNALQEKDYDTFIRQLLYFVLLVTAFIVIAVYRLYLRQMLEIRWRRWLTDRFLGDWLGRQAYYRLQFAEGATDNPDQRISDDARLFVNQTLIISLDLLSNVVTLISFFGILWRLSGTLTIPLGGMSIDVPGYMVWVALLYSVVGTWIAHRLGRPLVGINFQRQRYEADFRFALVRVRENAEGVALYRGEADELGSLRDRFAAIVANWRDVMRFTKRLTWFTAGFGQVANVFPVVVAAPRYFSGAIQLGGLMQTASAFGEVQGAMSWFVNAYATLAEWKATVDRLTGFTAALARTASVGVAGIAHERAPGPDVSLAKVGVRLPDDRALVQPVDLALAPGESVLLSGPSGSGKSTVFRVLGGLWPFGEGRVRLPEGARFLFLPQKPYLPLGPLRAVVAYPKAAEGIADEDIRRALADCGLGHLGQRLDEVRNWAQQLSPGEQQRIAFARALLYRPDWLFLDEATSALDQASETALYRLVKERLPDTTLVSIAHRASLAALHDRRLELRPAAEGSRVEEVAARPAA